MVPVPRPSTQLAKPAARPGLHRCAGAQRQRHQQGRADDARAGAAVKQAQHQGGAHAGPQRQLGRQQAASHKSQCAAHPQGQAQHGQAAFVAHKAMHPQQQRRRPAGGHAQRLRGHAPQQPGHGQGAQQVAHGIGGVQRAGGDVAPTQVLAHGGQQQRIRETREPQGHRGRQSQGQRLPPRGVGGGGGRVGHAPLSRLVRPRPAACLSCWGVCP